MTFVELLEQVQKITICYWRSIIGSLKGLLRKICKRQRHCLMRYCKRVDYRFGEAELRLYSLQMEAHHA